MIFVHYSSKKLEQNKISFSSSERNDAVNIEFKEDYRVRAPVPVLWFPHALCHLQVVEEP